MPDTAGRMPALPLPCGARPRRRKIADGQGFWGGTVFYGSNPPWPVHCVRQTIKNFLRPGPPGGHALTCCGPSALGYLSYRNCRADGLGWHGGGPLALKKAAESESSQFHRGQHAWGWASSAGAEECSTVAEVCSAGCCGARPRRVYIVSDKLSKTSCGRTPRVMPDTAGRMPALPLPCGARPRRRKIADGQGFWGGTVFYGSNPPWPAGSRKPCVFFTTHYPNHP